MEKILISLTLIASASLHAQVRTWVSTTGLDTHPCTRTQPCRNFNAAITAAATGAEVVVLDSGGFGPVTATKSIALISPEGIHAAIAPTVGAAVTIDAGGGQVVLRNLYLNSQGATYGVRLMAGNDIFIENSVIAGFNADGVSLYAPGGIHRCFISDSTIRNNGDYGVSGRITMDALDSRIEIVIEHSRILANPTGVGPGGGTRTLIRDSLVSGNNYGIFGADSVGGDCRVTIENSDVSNNEFAGFVMVDAFGGGATAYGLIANSLISENVGNGIEVGANVQMRISNCTITRNATGVSFGVDAMVLSRGNNTIRGNRTAETSAALTPLAPL